MGNICFLIGNIDHSGGTERVTTIIKWICSKKFQVHILSLCIMMFFEQHENIKNSSLSLSLIFQCAVIYWLWFQELEVFNWTSNWYANSR